MGDLSQHELAVIAKHPLNDSLDQLQDPLRRAELSYGASSISYDGTVASSEQDRRKAISRLLNTLSGHEVAFVLRSRTGNGDIGAELSALSGRVRNGHFNYEHYRALSRLVIKKVSDVEIWKAVFDLIAQANPIRPPTTPPHPGPSIASSCKDTPSCFNTGGFQNTSEPVERVREVLKSELQSNLELGHPEFITTYFAVPQVEHAAAAVFKKCREGKNPLYMTGDRWRGWEDNDEKGVQRSLEEYVSKFTKFLDEAGIKPPSQRQFVASPNHPIPGSVKRKPDLCVATIAGVPAKSNKQIASWPQILVAIELKSSGQDRLEKTWSDIMKYARQIFRHQDSRRFVLGLTLCGSIARLWEFDRLGATTSEPFDIHRNGLLFVKTLLSFLWMNDEQLGFDPDLTEVNGRRFVKINRDGKEERLIITETLRDHAACIAGRATTCWKVYRDGDRSRKPLVVKDSWQYVDRLEEGELILKATTAGVTNISPYYHHETVLFNSREDYIRSNVRNGMSTEGGTNPFVQSDFFSPGIITSSKASSSLSKGVRSSQISQSQKRAPSQIEAPEPAQKRSRSSMAAKEGEDRSAKDRVRRRIVTQRVGKPLRNATSLAAILIGILGGIKGHESLHQANILHRDVSIGNILLNEDESDGFLIDLDLAIDTARLEASGAPGKTGTKVFMAIDALHGKPHSFMHDLESFFWVLFWICIHYTGPGKERYDVGDFKDWNYELPDKLTMSKSALVLPKYFEARLSQFTTDYCRPMIPLVTKLWKEVFPHGQNYEHDDKTLYDRMKAVLEKGRDQLIREGTS